MLLPSVAIVTFLKAGVEYLHKNVDLMPTCLPYLMNHQWTHRMLLGFLLVHLNSLTDAGLNGARPGQKVVGKILALPSRVKHENKYAV